MSTLKEKKTDKAPKTLKKAAAKPGSAKKPVAKKKVPAAKKTAAAAKQLNNESSIPASAAKKKAKLPGLMELLIEEADKPAAASGALPPVEKGKSGNLPAPEEKKEIEEIDPDSITRGDHPMSIVDHLDEFRSRFLKVLLAFIIFTSVAFYFSNDIVYYINKPFLDTNNQLHIFKLTGGFMLRFKASAGTAILLLIPYLLFHAWRFIAPAIGKSERMFSRLTIISSVLLFYSGVALCSFYLSLSASKCF